jgi:hypothetical protein
MFVSSLHAVYNYYRQSDGTEVIRVGSYASTSAYLILFLGLASWRGPVAINVGTLHP